MRDHNGADRRPHIHQKQLCNRIRFSESRCEKCLSECPAGALHIGDDLLEIDNSCTGCLFCVASCPNEVFSTSSGPPQQEKSAQPDVLYCSGVIPRGTKIPADLPPSIIPCLGSIPSRMILDRVLRKKSPLKVITGFCELCEMKQGESSFRRREREIHELLPILGIGVLPLATTPATDKEKRDGSEIVRGQWKYLDEKSAISRRDLLLSFRDRIVRREQPKEVDSAVGTRPSRIDRRPTDTMRHVIALTQSKRANASSPKTIPFFREIHIEENCTGCGVCAALCPTGALSLKKTRDSSELLWRAAHCSRCDLCTEACGKRAIRFLPGVEIEKVARETVTAIKRFYNHLCPECRTSFLSPHPKAQCPCCSKTERVIEGLFQMIYGSDV
ncbi:MAG: hypothetical protein CVU64_07745 [Deltaproteobacteria bacterium HGW-Deltaproteobacteria-21]|nr:MAG: hypothetical protein CVU64_07745 [Deltaproteobacteria bacterium HGW-Deltaproteobacteria-21]